MAKINARNKGASGEREFCQWLYDHMDIPMPTRNLEQVRSGGADVIDIHPFYFEVKRCEKLSIYNWWLQVRKAVEATCDEAIIPVVAFRQSRKSWEFLVPATLIGAGKGHLRISERTFLLWIKYELENGMEIG